MAKKNAAAAWDQTRTLAEVLAPEELAAALERRLPELAREVAAVGVPLADYAPWQAIRRALPPADADRLEAALAERVAAAPPVEALPRPGSPVPSLRHGDHWAGALPWTYPEAAIVIPDDGPARLDLTALTLWLAADPDAPLRWLAPVNRGLWCYRPDKQRWVRGEDAVAALLARVAAPWGMTVTGEKARTAAEAIANLNLAHEHALDSVLPPEAIPVPEGILDPLTGSLNPHDPAHCCTVQLAARWDPSAHDPQEYAGTEDFLDRFLVEVLPDGIDREGFLRAAGLAATRLTTVQRFFVLLGEGNNGKSKALLLLTKTLGKENVAGETLQSLADKFGAAALEGRLANICPDIPTSRLEDAGTIKALVGGDLVRAERKYQPQFTFQNFATLIFSANTLPPANDHSQGFFRRIHLIPFTQSFTGREDNDLERKLARPPVLTAFLRRAVDALRRCAAEDWTIPMSAGALTELEEYRQNLDNVYAYAQECLTPDANSYVFKEELYADYKMWAEDARVGIASQQSFFRRLRSLPGFGLRDYRPDGPDRRRAFAGARLTTRYHHAAAVGGVVGASANKWPDPLEDPLP